MTVNELSDVKKCENCTHQFVCKIKNENMKENCPHYQDKSRVIVLPCKVGDEVYFVKSMFSFMSMPKAEKVRKIEITKYDTIYRTESRTFNEKEINNTVFLTKDKAEKTLKERENNG
ncbi:MAG: hypothetical protein K2F81_00585 [Ruminococcus sp.]|nr:hypothetical protein [Ruminococcus sp.]